MTSHRPGCTCEECFAPVHEQSLGFMGYRHPRSLPAKPGDRTNKLLEQILAELKEMNRRLCER